MGNGFVSRTRRQVVETVRERVHTDVTEIVPVGGAHAARLSPGGDPNWLNRQLAQQVHDKFEDMVRRTPNPTRAERSSYEELLRSFPSAGSNRLRLGPADGAGGGARDSNAWSGGGGGGGGDGTYASAPWMSASARERRAAANGDGELFENLASPPPSFRAVSASGGTPASNGVSLDDLILRRRAPDDAARAAPPPRAPPSSPRPSRLPGVPRDRGGAAPGNHPRDPARRRRRRRRRVAARYARRRRGIRPEGCPRRTRGRTRTRTRTWRARRRVRSRATPSRRRQRLGRRRE